MNYDALKPLTNDEYARIRDHFCKPEISGRWAMRNFLRKHPRYHTMNAWNGHTSYAHCIKITHLPFPSDVNNSDMLWALMTMDEWQCKLSSMIDLFGMDHNYDWQIGTNGRSDGYLVLYRGKNDDDKHTKSCCNCCGIRTGYDDGNCRRIECNGMLIPVNNPKNISVSCVSVDQDENFDDWDNDDLSERCKLIQEFDMFCAGVAIEYASWCRSFKIESETIMIPKKMHVLVPAEG